MQSIAIGDLQSKQVPSFTSIAKAYATMDLENSNDNETFEEEKEFDFTLADLGNAMKKHVTYFAEFYANNKVKTRAMRERLKKQGVVFTGAKHRISKKFFPIVENYMEATTITSNGKNAYVVLSTTINDKQEVKPTGAMFFPVLSNKEHVYVFYNDREKDSRQLFGIRGHAIARYKERAANVPAHEAIKEIYRIIKTEAFLEACEPYRKAALETLKKVNMTYVIGNEELRITVSSIYSTVNEERQDRGLNIIVQTYINRSLN